MEPRYAKAGFLAPEARLEIGLMASVFIPISLFMFGWSSRESVHWYAPLIAADHCIETDTLTLSQDRTRHRRCSILAWHIPGFPVYSDVPLHVVPEVRWICLGGQRSFQVSLLFEMGFFMYGP